MASKRTKSIGIYAVILGFLLIGAMMFLTAQPRSTYKYYQIIEYFEKGEVTDYKLSIGSGELVMNLNDDKKTQIVYKVPSVDLFLSDVKPIVEKYNEEHPDNKVLVDYERPADIPWWVSMLPSVGLIILMLVLWFYMMNKANGGAGNAMSFGKAKVKQQSDRPKTTFKDVAGADEEKAELEEIVDFLRSPRKFTELGARIPKGVLLMGPPGTGKTLLARAVAGEAGVPFFSISGSDFVEMFVGVGASRVRDLFDQAKKNAPSIIFIDEIDAVGRQRGAGLGGGHDEREQTLNQLLVEMDGFTGNESVIIIAATNRRDILDPALLRPGRFDREILVGYPDVKGREAILRVHSRNKPLGPDVDLSVIAKTTSGFTGADLENLMNESALLAARKNKKAITMEEIEEATIKVVAGPEKKSHVVSDKEKKLTSYHEAGHAVATFYADPENPVHQISIIPRGMAGGYTMSLPIEDKNYVLQKDMFASLVTLLGGRAAEKLILEDISTGASNDIQRATQVARNMVTQYGFSEKLGPIQYGTDQGGGVFLGRDFGHTRDYSEEIAGEIDAEIRKLIDRAYQTTQQILTEHIDQLHQVAQYLFNHEKMDGELFDKMMRGEYVEDAFQQTSFVSNPVQAEQKEESGELPH